MGVNQLTGKQKRNKKRKKHKTKTESKTETDTKFCFMATLTELTWPKARVAGREWEREREREGQTGRERQIDNLLMRSRKGGTNAKRIKLHIKDIKMWMIK